MNGHDLQLFERDLRVRRVLTQLGELGVDDLVELFVAERVERDHRVLHPRRLVGPPLHRRRRTLPLGLLDITVRSRPRLDLGDQQLEAPFEVPRRTLSIAASNSLGGGFDLQPLDIGQTLGQPRQHIDVLGRHLTVGERVLEPGHRRTRTVAFLSRLRVTRRAVAAEQRLEPTTGLTDSLQFVGASRDPHVDIRGVRLERRVQRRHRSQIITIRAVDRRRRRGG